MGSGKKVWKRIGRGGGGREGLGDGILEDLGGESWTRKEVKKW